MSFFFRTVNGQMDVKALGTVKIIPTQYQPLLAIIASKPPWGIYDAAKWNSSTNVLPEIRGNGRDATSSGTITLGKASGNGATSAISYLDGSTASRLFWPAGSIPTNFTLCTITRYSGATKGRIMHANAGNWLHGHWGTARGVCYYEGWRTNTSNVGTQTDWLVACGKNSATTPGNILMDGTAVGTTGGGSGGGSYTLAINPTSAQFSGETSDWQMSYVLIWDQNLTDAEMVSVSSALQYYLTSGITIV